MSLNFKLSCACEFLVCVYVCESVSVCGCGCNSDTHEPRRPVAVEMFPVGRKKQHLRNEEWDDCLESGFGAGAGVEVEAGSHCLQFTAWNSDNNNRNKCALCGTRGTSKVAEHGKWIANNELNLFEQAAARRRSKSSDKENSSGTAA